MQIFVDMDGVLADFDAGYQAAFGSLPSKEADNVDWEAVRSRPSFYALLPPMHDLSELWSYLAPHRPIVLTGVPKEVPAAATDKRIWAEKHLGTDVEVRCCRSRDKCLHAKPGDLLIDDWVKYRHHWIEQGGLWITHVSAADTIRQLRELGLG